MSIDPASIHDIKNALKTLTPVQVQDYIMRLAKYKKENKEFLSFLLFMSGDLQQYIKDVKHQIEVGFGSLNTGSTYISVKGIRKILKLANKHIKFSGDKVVETEVLIWFCYQLKNSHIRLASSSVLKNMYDRQMQRIYRSMELLHEDIQADYRKEIADLEGH
ncbi:MAG: hypothetical protein IT244_08770 [Bacteroidia bacterium]|nr:hypothetical protein [Bacteroidia bacterium]